MIYFLSDFHGGENAEGFKKYLETAKDDDLLIVLGDIGLNFEKTEENREFTELFLKSDKKIAFIDGNHENFDHLYGFPIEVWNGGLVHRLTPNIVHLRRGNIFYIEGKSFFVFGGCKSSGYWKELGLWYPQEEATEAEIALAYENIEKNGAAFDYILTHKYNADKSSPPADAQEKLFRYIDKEVKFTRWFSGHWHQTLRFDDRHLCVYDKLTELTCE